MAVQLDPCAELAAAPLFRGAAPQDFEPLRPHIRERTFSTGEHLWRAGEPATSVFMILSGQVVARRIGPEGEEYVVEVYLEHDIVGQLPLFEENPTRLLSGVAADRTHCLVFPLAELRRLVELRPQVLKPMVAAYAQWIRWRDAQASEGAFQNLAARLACKLLELHVLTGTSRGEPIAMDLPQARLAAMLGASRENVNRALARLVQRGDVSRLGRTLLIRDPDELKRRYSWAASAEVSGILARKR